MKREISDVLYLDLRDVNAGQFFPVLCLLMGLEIPLRGFELKRALGDRKYILCLDEIDQMTDKERFTKNDQDQLCSLCDGEDSEMSLIVASRVALQILFPDEPYRSSPLHGLCGRSYIQPISLQQSQQFITTSLYGTDVEFTDQQIQRIQIDSRGRPREILDLSNQQYEIVVKS